MKVVWTHQACERLAEIHDFVARDSADAADRLIDKLIQKGDRLARFPDSGRRIPEIPGSQLREWIEGNYRIVYRVRRTRIEILTVFEAHRLFPLDDMSS